MKFILALLTIASLQVSTAAFADDEGTDSRIRDEALATYASADKDADLDRHPDALGTYAARVQQERLKFRKLERTSEPAQSR